MPNPIYSSSQSDNLEGNTVGETYLGYTVLKGTAVRATARHHVAGHAPEYAAGNVPAYAAASNNNAPEYAAARHVAGHGMHPSSIQFGVDLRSVSDDSTIFSGY